MKLMTWRQWAMLVPALIGGSTMRLYGEYRETGTMRTSSIVISIVVFCLGLLILAALSWHANRPEKEDSE